MKILFVLLVLSLSIPSDAAVAIYKAAVRETIIGNGQTVRFSGHGWLVLDPDTLASYQITATTVNRSKIFTVVQHQKYIGGAVSGSVGSYTYLAKAESPGTQFADTLLESDSIIGRNAVVVIEPSVQRFLPRLMTGSATGVLLNPQTGNPNFVTATTTFTLDAGASLASNKDSETLLGLVNAYTTILTRAGYVQFVPPPAN